ncbi:MAG: TlpA disulfide reductase family protein [Lacibacter sp.]
MNCLRKILVTVVLLVQLMPLTAQRQTGWYRATLQRADGIAVPVTFEVTGRADALRWIFFNASERITADPVQYKGDSVWVRMPFFESQIRCRVLPNGALQGVWEKETASGLLTLAFTAQPGKAPRFAHTAPPTVQAAGKWQVRIQRPNGTYRPAVALLEQQGSRLTGTFLTPSGDYRYLEGVVSNDTLLLSCFDGARAYLFRARVAGDSIVDGVFYNNTAPLETWVAQRNENAALPDTVLQTALKPGYDRIAFSFPDSSGRMVSLTDARFQNKVVVVQLLGSWCPNCLDETRFLMEFYRNYRDKGVEVVALAYELFPDAQRSWLAVKKMIRRLQIPYPVLLTPATAGDADKTEKTLPQLNSVHYFPTTLFIAKDGTVARIHQGFYGPGTGAYYEQFKEEFFTTIQTLLSR